MSSGGCRILDEEELENLQWRKDTEEVRISRIFGSEPRKVFPSVFQNNNHKSVFQFRGRPQAQQQQPQESKKEGSK